MIKMVAIDDMPEIGIILQLALESLVDLTFFSESLKAHDYLLANEFDLILTDINMGTFSGQDLLHMFHGQKEIWAMSYFEDMAAKEHLKKMGFNQIVAKPFDIYLLQKMIIDRFSLNEIQTPSMNINYQDDIGKYKIRYIESTLKDLENLKTFIASENSDKVCLFCHNIKGSAPMFGLPGLTSFAQHLHFIVKKKELHLYKKELLMDLELLSRNLLASTL